MRVAEIRQPVQVRFALRAVPPDVRRLPVTVEAMYGAPPVPLPPVGLVPNQRLNFMPDLEVR